MKLEDRGWSNSTIVMTLRRFYGQLNTGKQFSCSSLKFVKSTWSGVTEMRPSRTTP
jgi:hypothetical protein